jgi:hypothetical protein
MGGMGASGSQGLGDLSGMMSMIQQMASNFGGMQGGRAPGGDSARRRARLRSKLDKKKKSSS